MTSPQPQGDIETAADEVADRVVQADVEHHVGIGGVEAGQHGPQVEFGGGMERHHPHDAGRRPARPGGGPGRPPRPVRPSPVAPAGTGRRSPASVSDTLRVVRLNSRTPARSSKPRTSWRRAEGDTPRFLGRTAETQHLADRDEGCRSWPKSLLLINESKTPPFS